MHRLLLFLITAALFAPARAQWTEPVRIGVPGGVLYPQILAQGDTLHVVYSNNHGGWKIGYVRSTDGGDTWSDQYVLSDTSNTTVTYFPKIINNYDTLMVLWHFGLDQWPYNYNIGSSVSSDGGLTWGVPEYVLNPGWSYPFFVAASGEGPIINIETSGAPDNTMIFYNIRSTNFGQGWSEPVEIFRAAQSGLTDQAGFNNLVHYVWGGRFDWESRWETYYVKSTDEGISWSESIALSEEDEYHSYSPSLWADEQGFLALSWFDYKYSPYFLTGDILLRQSVDSGNTWLAEQQITRNHLAMGQSDVVSKGDTIDVVWEDLGEGLDGRSIYYSRSIDFGENWSEPLWLDGTDDDSWNPALATSNGNVYAVWAEDRDDPGIGLYFSRYRDQTDIVDEEPIIPQLAFLQAYPNPFNSRVMISLNMVKGGDADISIFDVNGRLVKTLFKGGNLQKGTHNFSWDATDASGKEVSSGSYFAVATTPQGKIIRTLTLIR